MLPQNLMDIILRLLAASGGGIITIVSISQVCKAWRDAFAAYPAAPELVLDRIDAIAILAKMMPSMSSLDFTAIVKNVDLSPLSACTQLTSLCIEESPDIDDPDIPNFALKLDLSDMPASLETLTVDSVDATLVPPFSPVSPVYLQRLTKVVWQPKRWMSDSLCTVVHLMPELRVRTLPHWCHLAEGSGFLYQVTCLDFYKLLYVGYIMYQQSCPQASLEVMSA